MDKTAFAVFQEVMQAFGWEVESYKNDFGCHAPSVLCANSSEFRKALADSPVEVHYEPFGITNTFTVVYPLGTDTTPYVPEILEEEEEYDSQNYYAFDEAE